MQLIRSFNLLLFCLLLGCSHGENDALKNGDIIFQNSQSSQCQAIQLATGSEYSHVGIVYIKEGKPYVYEAVQPVKMTPLKQWVNRGKGKHYVVKRLKDETVLTDEVLQKMSSEGKKFLGKNYDALFGWSDERIYCSELVWKIYKRGAGIDVGEIRKMKEYNFDHPIVKAEAEKRYGKSIPMEEDIVAPSDIFDAKNLKTIYEGSRVNAKYK